MFPQPFPFPDAPHLATHDDSHPPASLFSVAKKSKTKFPQNKNLNK